MSVRLACLMHAASVDPEPGSNSPNRSRRVATATFIRGFDRSHILVQMFPVTLQLLRCSVEAQTGAWRRTPSMRLRPVRRQTHRSGWTEDLGPVAPASWEVARRRILGQPDPPVKRPSVPLSSGPSGTPSAMAIRECRRAHLATVTNPSEAPSLVAANPRQTGLDSTSRMNAAALSQHSRTSSTDPG